MDLKPNINRYKNTGQLVKNDLPSIDFSSIQFIPVISCPQTISGKKKTDLLSINKNRAFIISKNTNGQQIYINTRYKIQNIDTTSARYKELLASSGRKKIEEQLRKIQSRRNR